MSKLIFLALFLCFAVPASCQFDVWRWWTVSYTPTQDYGPTTKPTTPYIPKPTTTRYIPRPTTRRPRPTTRKPRPTTRKPRPTTTPPPTTTPLPIDDGHCGYVEGSCQIVNGGVSYSMLTSTVPGCPDRRKDCEDGKLMAQLLQGSFLSPSAIKKPGVSFGQRPGPPGPNGGPALGGRTVTIDKATGSQTPCLVIRNANGSVITGGCTNQNEYLTSTTSRKRRAIPPPIIQTKRDVLIVMDESGSVGKDNYKKIRRMAAAIVKLLCGSIRYDKDLTRVAVMSFDQYYRIHVPLNKFYNNPDALANFIIDKIKYNSYSARRTCMSKALRFGYQIMLSKPLGARLDQYDVEQDIFLITDGCANCDRRYGSIANTIDQLSQELKARDIRTYVIGIGLERDRDNCKENLQTLAQGGRCFHFFYLDRWDYDVDIFLQQLEHPPNNRCLNTFEHPLGQCLPPLPPSP